jgi:hypothetical protein
MKYLLILTIGFFLNSAYAENCSESQTESSEQVVYNVSKDMPKHLKGATITITLADGKTSTVPAEKFMVVPRKQTTVLGENKTISKKLTCSNGKKNSIIAGGRKDTVGHRVETSSTPNGQQAKVYSEKDLVPDINYYRREILDTPIGAGVGVDSNGTLRGSVGFDF